MALLPIGRLRFIDIFSLQHDFQEIFLQECYDTTFERPDPLVLDCGANVGLSVLWFKMRYPESRIIAFEADPEIATVLKENLRALNFQDVKVFCAAAWTTTGKVCFIPYGANSGQVSEEGNGKLIDAIRLAELISEPVDLLKLDVEGTEYVLIRDLYETGKIGLVQRIISEFHVRSVKDQERLIEVFEILHKSSFRFTINRARSAPDLPGTVYRTPFPAVPDNRFLLHVYAWKG